MNKAQLVTVVSVAGVDRITKYLVTQHIPVNENFEVIPGFFRLTHLQNPGGAFVLFAASTSRWRAPALIVFSMAALAIIFVLLWRNRRTNVHTVALSLILGGAIGNLWDRLVSGSVTDFIDFYLDSHHWYPFNIADSAIVAGAMLLLKGIFLVQQEKKPGNMG